MKSLKDTAEKTLVKASEVYMRYTTWTCFGFFYQPPIPEKVKERFGKKDK